MHPFVNTAIKAAREAGNIITHAWERLDTLSVQEKSRHDFTTEIDHAAEATIIDILHQAYPKHSFLGEESGAQTFEEEYTWLIDPLDGTTNFMRKLPHFAVSIAVCHHDQLAHGIIYDPIRQELFTASKGSGAQLNSRRMRVSKHTSLDGALLGTGFPLQNHQDIKKYTKQINAFYPHVASFRASGCSALDLAYVASGRLDGFWKADLKPWDVAAGALMIREAGGIVSDFKGQGDYVHGGEIVAANPKLFDAILKEMQ